MLLLFCFKLKLFKKHKSKFIWVSLFEYFMWKGYLLEFFVYYLFRIIIHLDVQLHPVLQLFWDHCFNSDGSNFYVLNFSSIFHTQAKWNLWFF